MLLSLQVDFPCILCIFEIWSWPWPFECDISRSHGIYQRSIPNNIRGTLTMHINTKKAYFSHIEARPWATRSRSWLKMLFFTSVSFDMWPFWAFSKFDLAWPWPFDLECDISKSVNELILTKHKENTMSLHAVISLADDNYTKVKVILNI